MKYAIGIDLGGTNIKAVAVTDAGDVLARVNAPTEDRADAPWQDRVRDAVREIETTHGKAAAIGLSAPGLASPDGRCIASMEGRMSGLQGLDWTKFLGRPVHVLNDAHAALMGELWLGAAVNCPNAALLTLGTGVGGAIVCDGRLLKGHIGRAGHLGHIALGVEGPKDNCNAPCSLEDSIGELSVKRRSNNRYPTTKDLVTAHIGGDPVATEIWLHSIKSLAAGIASIVNSVDPEVVIIGGGIAKAGAVLFDPLAKFMDEFEWRPNGHRVRIVPARLGHEAGAFGAAHNARMKETL